MGDASQYKTTSAEVGTYIEYKTSRIGALEREYPGALVKICFPSTPDVVQAAMDFASGCPESKLLGIRSRLYRRIREVKP